MYSQWPIACLQAMRITVGAYRDQLISHCIPKSQIESKQVSWCFMPFLADLTWFTVSVFCDDLQRSRVSSIFECNEVQSCTLRTWWQMWELVARGRAFPLRLPEPSEKDLRGAARDGDGVSKVSRAVSRVSREVRDWEDWDDWDESDVERVVTAVAASDETSTSGTSGTSAGAAALVVALPMECLARVFTFMGTGSDMKIISDIPRLSRHLVLPNKEPKDNKKVLRCCKHLLSQGFCNHGQVVQGQRRANARPVESASFTSVSATHLSCWYCSSIFPYGQDGVQDKMQSA